MGWPKKSLPSVVPCEGRHQVSSFARAKLTENLLWFAMVFKIFISEQSEHPPRSYLHARCETKRLEFFWWPHLLKEVAVTRPRCRTQHFLFMRFLPAHFSSLSMSPGWQHDPLVNQPLLPVLCHLQTCWGYALPHHPGH